MFTCQTLKQIFESHDFREDLNDLSAYAASIKQEHAIVLLIAKQLYRQTRNFALEQKKTDLVVEGTKIEFKFHYDFDITWKLKRELDENLGGIAAIWEKACSGTMSKTWTVIPGIYKDVCEKLPDIFVWIICARDVGKLSPDELKRICLGAHQRKYNEKHPYSKREFLVDVDRFLNLLQSCRPFSLETTTIETTRDFPSTYYVYLCEFRETTCQIE